VFVEEARGIIEAKAEKKRRQQQEQEPAAPPAAPTPSAMSKAERDRRLLGVFVFAVDAWDEKKYEYVVQALDEGLDELEPDDLTFADFAVDAGKAIHQAVSWPGARELAAKASEVRLRLAA
jgi:hypothetical protein